MSWQQLQNAGRVRPHTTSKKELDDLRAIVERDLQDADLEELSDDRRFATAYNAALQTSKMVIACAGFRVAGRGHHQATFEAIELAIGPPAATYSAFLDMCRRKRNMVDYDMSGVATEAEVEQLINETKAFLALAETWISQHYAAFGKTP